MPGIKTLITEFEALRLYDDMLDDSNETVTVAGSQFSPSCVLRSLDPIAYREGFSQYVDFLIEGGYEVEGY